MAGDRVVKALTKLSLARAVGLRQVLWGILESRAIRELNLLVNLS